MRSESQKKIIKHLDIEKQKYLFIKYTFLLCIINSINKIIEINII